MNGEFFQDAGSRSDGIGTAEKRSARFLGGCDEAPGDRLVSRNIAVQPFFHIGRNDSVGIGDSLYVRSIVVAVVQDFPVRGYEFRMFFPELLFQIIIYVLDRPVVNIRGHAECEHVLAFVDSLLVKSAVFQAFFGKRSDRRDDDGPVFYLQFGDRIHGHETGLPDPFFIESVFVNKHKRRAFKPPGIRFQRCGIHGHQHVAEISRSSDMAGTEMYLKTGNAGNCPVGSPDLCRKVRESGEFVSVDGRHVRKE